MIPVPNIGASIAQMRAVYETGKTLPVDARYSPDWKKDPATPVESYSVRRRHTDDILISFVNRKIQVCQLPITVELDSLGFSADVRINVWAMPTQCKAEKNMFLAIQNRGIIIKIWVVRTNCFCTEADLFR